MSHARGSRCPAPGAIRSEGATMPHTPDLGKTLRYYFSYAMYCYGKATINGAKKVHERPSTNGNLWDPRIFSSGPASASVFSSGPASASAFTEVRFCPDLRLRLIRFPVARTRKPLCCSSIRHTSKRFEVESHFVAELILKTRLRCTLQAEAEPGKARAGELL